MKINDTTVTELEKPYLIAEIGVNYFDIAEQRKIPPLEAAKQMVAKAAEAGADAVKFQSYSADRLASENSPAYWNTEEEETENQYDLFAQFDNFGAAEFEEIAEWTARNYEVEFMSTPFDSHAVDYLEDLVPVYKVASADITNHPLLREIAAKGKPVLLSTGASTVGEIDEAIQVIEDEQPDAEICLLHCILQYPTDEENANLEMIEHLNDAFPEHLVGYSDHVPPDDSMITLLNATVKGAQIIEKHFTLDKTLRGNDHYHAMDPGDIRAFIENHDRFVETSGDRTKEPIPAEQDSRTHARRSLVAAVAIEEGDCIRRDDIAIKRPGTGIEPKRFDEVIGRTARRDIERDQILTWEDI
ncbi:N-acetylneuraminate synthase family protein [Halosimplex aquaticum]|uniref:N-acetylneuraminate synthase family protein n=1 Tax=Halosimplex aquaticum TaxID=3026162 RepID=A0ABD5Y3J4_9EURY|nr:N-acetylneuraminate synthase family protein [Halosimplex aquaticum]